MSLLDFKSLPALSGERVAVLKSYEEITNNKGGYVALTFKLEDRNFTYPLFPGQGDTEGKQINYFMSAVRNQLGLKEGVISLVELLDLMKAQETEISIWFSYNSEFNRLNVEFHQPAPQPDSIEDTLDEIVGA